jgi:hypothetical protein
MDFSRPVSKETTTASIVERMTGLYRDWENVRSRWYSARAAMTRKA